MMGPTECTDKQAVAPDANIDHVITFWHLQQFARAWALGCSQVDGSSGCELALRIKSQKYSAAGVNGSPVRRTSPT